jgi:hypothetical protein
LYAFIGHVLFPRTWARGQTSETEDIKFNQNIGIYHIISRQQDTQAEEWEGESGEQQQEENDIDLAGLSTSLTGEQTMTNETTAADQQDTQTEEWEGETNEVQDVKQNHMAGIYHPLFDEYGVDLVLYAHIHTYDRSYPIKYVGDITTEYQAIIEKSLNNYILPEGQVYSTVGTGGAYIHGLYTKTRFLASQYDGHGF